MAHLTCYYCGAPTPAQAAACAHCGNALLLRGRYRLRRVLGQGGFGTVLQADDTHLGRPCAIKQVQAATLAEQQQIANEAHILARHAAHCAFMPTVYDIWVDQRQTAVVMEYIDGPTLDQTRLPWTPDHVAHFLTTMLENLARLHRVPIIHRDIKPQNIKYTPHGRCPYMLLDFGLSKQGAARSLKALSPDYAPPEQIHGQPTDARSDLYSLGATAYYLLTAQPPLHVRMQTGGTLPTPRQFAPTTSPHLERPLMWLLEYEPDRRPASAQAALGLRPDQQPPALHRPLADPHGVDSSAGQATVRVADMAAQRAVLPPETRLDAMPYQPLPHRARESGWHVFGILALSLLLFLCVLSVLSRPTVVGIVLAMALLALLAMLVSQRAP